MLSLSVKRRDFADKLFKIQLVRETLPFYGQTVDFASTNISNKQIRSFCTRNPSVNARHHMIYLLMSSPRLWASRISVEEISTIGASRSWM